jgi:hypothetical protein
VQRNAGDAAQKENSGIQLTQAHWEHSGEPARKETMANLTLAQLQTLQTANRNWNFAVEDAATASNAGIAGPDLTVLQSALNTLKTALSGLGFTIS